MRLLCNLHNDHKPWIYILSIICTLPHASYAEFILGEDATHQYVDARTLGARFVGKGRDQESFKLLKSAWPHIIVGSKNILYNISVEDFSESTVLQWQPTKADLHECTMKGKSADSCQNYIRLYATNNDGTSLVCGTNAFKPLCRVYSRDNANVLKEFSAAGVLPYDVRQNSSFVYAPDTQELFSATTADFGGSDPLIYKTDLTKTDSLGLRTDRYNKDLLNEPNFVSSVLTNDFVYFWFREVAYESTSNDKAMYARVARICRNDRGTKHRESWTSFVKARLNCSVPREFPYYFDELVAISQDQASALSPTGARIIYAVFNSPSNIVPSSAICAYRMDDVERVFAYSDLKTAPSDGLRSARHGYAGSTKKRSRSCVNDSYALSEDAVNFLISNPLIKDAVPSVPESPLLVMLGHNWKFTQIAVHSQVIAADGREYDVMFIGTDNGKLLKVISKPGDNDKLVPVIIEIITVFAGSEPITGLHVERPLVGGRREPGKPQLLVISNAEIRLLPLFHCALSPSCAACVRLQDPYCAWDRRRNACVGETSWSERGRNNSRAARSIVTRTKDCPQAHAMPSSNGVALADHDRETSAQAKVNQSKAAETVARLENRNVSEQSTERSTFESVKYEAEAVKVTGRTESFAIAIPLTFVFSSLFGFLVGYGCRLSQRMKKDSIQADRSLYGTDLANFAGCKANKRKISVVNNYATSMAPFAIYGTLPRESHALNCASRLTAGSVRPMTNCNTLPKPQLVKKVYV